MPPARHVPARAATQLEALLPDLLRLAAYLLRDRAAAEDMVQDIVLRLWTRMLAPGEPPIEDLRSYAFTALRNGLRDRRSPTDETSELPEASDPRASAQGPARLACADTLAALETLPEEQAALIRLRAIDGLSYDEIATRLSLPEGTVTSRLSRARAALRDKLDLPDGAPVTFLLE